jgi:hypothetical protein
LQEVDFHQRAAAETLQVIDALGSIGRLGPQRRRRDRPAGGARRATTARRADSRGDPLVAEQPGSRAFFDTMADPDALGPRVVEVLARSRRAVA